MIQTQWVKQLQQLGIKNEIVLSAINTVPWQAFYEPETFDADIELPVDMGDVLSHIYQVAVKLQPLFDEKADLLPKKILEIGTGRGYQTAVIAEVVEHVYSIERNRSRLSDVEKRFLEWEVKKVSLKYADGFLGWPEFSPYDGIVVNAYVETIPETFIEQLKEGAKMIVPMGNEENQILYLVTKQGKKVTKTMMGVVHEPPFVRGTE
ncbi:MAG: protein-L-isoaspartate O-methyltransferase [Pseudomonadota bacterium]|nr:protein-L-isoaspartate O-methyltransferase [Gammaproteobacteria bacterium]MBU1926188.1 protein-L-isoaspartate O-methyltransferase [Gammaproteobacteria bacterium]MBU2545546.1 protein-L-isoaspartate O-methyltransferase [Gammaproteobacteria bacterium]